MFMFTIFAFLSQFLIRVRGKILGPNLSLKRCEVLCGKTQNRNHLLVLPKTPLQLGNPLTHTGEEIQLLSDRLFKKFDLWLPLHCWNLTFSCSKCPAYFFFHANFLVKTTNRHLIKGQPSFVFLFDKEISISSLAVRPVGERVSCQRHY